METVAENMRRCYDRAEPRAAWERAIVAGMLTAMPKRCPADAQAGQLRGAAAAYQHMGLPEESRRLIGWAEAVEARAEGRG